MIVSTANDVAGYRVALHLGVVRGITVRSRSVVGNFVGGIQSLFGGQLSVYVTLAETAREEAFDLMCSTPARAAPTPLSACATTPTKSWTGLPRCWPMAPPFGSSRRSALEPGPGPTAIARAPSCWRAGASNRCIGSKNAAWRGRPRGLRVVRQGDKPKLQECSSTRLERRSPKPEVAGSIPSTPAIGMNPY